MDQSKGIPMRRLGILLAFLLAIGCDTIVGPVSTSTSEGAGPPSSSSDSNGGTTPGGIVTDTPEPADTPQPSPTNTVVHLTMPGNPSGTTRFLTDTDTKPYAPQKKAIGGDEYPNNRWERPFTPEEMDYLPDIDIVRGEMRTENPWFYITIFLSDIRPEGVGHTRYGVEIDTDRDGRGDYLIWGISPPDSDWTTDGVEVWKDTNNDVGGPMPMVSNATADAGWLEGDGYDQKLFDGGQGADPDMAWIRQLEGGKKIQLAFKQTVLEGMTSFLWSVLADGGVQDEAWFDYNDRFTQAEAGSPLPVQTALYPVKEVYALDSTCRDAYGFTPTGTEPGLCVYVYNGVISGFVWRDVNCDLPEETWNDGVYQVGEPLDPGAPIQLGQGACPSSGLATQLTNGSGNYSFNSLKPGTYCVSLEGAVLNTPNAVTVVLGENDHKKVNFGIHIEALCIAPPR
jgi:hypothetical protein